MTGSKPGPARIRIPYGGEMLTYKEIGERTGLSPIRVAALWWEGRPIVRTNTGPKRALYKGKLLTAVEIAKLTGRSAKWIRSLIVDGQPLPNIEPKPKGRAEVLVEYNGEMLTKAEIARRMGRTKAFVKHRLERGIPLDAVLKHGPKPRSPEEIEEAKAKLLESGVRYIGRGYGENGLRWHEDVECLIWHLYCGGDGFGECSLEEIGALWDVCRERVRQIEVQALGKIRRAAARGNKDAINAIEFFRMRAEQRSRGALSHWEQAELNAPGSI